MQGKRPKIGRGQIVAIADVGSGSAALAIVLVSARRAAQVLSATRVVLPIEVRDREATVARVGAALEEASEKALAAYRSADQKVRAVEALYCVIRAPWVRSTTARAQADFREETAITDSMLSSLAKRALDENRALNIANLLEASIVNVKLNGYSTTKPENQRAHAVTVTTLFSVCDPALEMAVRASLQKSFPHLLPVYRSSSLSILSLLDSRPGPNEDHLAIEVLGEATTLSVVRDGALTHQQVIPEGVHTIIRRVAPQGIPEETLNLVRMISTGQCATAACQAIQAAMAKIEPELVRAFGEGMAECASRRKLPNALFLTTQDDMTEWLGAFFARIDFGQFTRTTQPFVVETVSPADLSDHVLAGKNITLDTGLAFSIALVNRELSRA